jgi:electron transfer flavoprotein alpha subunit
MNGSLFHTYVIIAQTEDGISEASRNLLRRVSSTYAGLDAFVEGIVIGGNDILNRESLNLCGIKKITHLKNASILPDSQAVKKAVFGLIPADEIVHIFSLNEVHVTALAASLAAAKHWQIYTNCTGNENIEAIARPVFGGKIDELRNISLSSCVVTVRANRENIETSPVEVEFSSIEIAGENESDYQVSLQKNAGKKSVSDASVVISGGRGMKSAENFSTLFKLAEIVDGAVGASRPVVDSAWLPHEHQVGQTGRTISPNLYIACGISGSVQHIAGMSTSKCIVAINTDKDAPIFSIADYGIIGDALEILPQLTAEIEKLK